LIVPNQIYCGDSLEVLKGFESGSIDCCITSPPYYALRDYGCKGQLGLEKTFHEYLNKLIEIFAEVKRVLKPTGTIWVNMGDSYNSHSTGQGNVGGLEGKRKDKENNKANISKQFKQVPDKCLLNIPSRFAIKMTDELNLIQRNEIIWYKRNCMPSSASDRFTVDFEKIYFFTKNKKYYFEQILEEISEVSKRDRRLDNGRFEYIGKNKNKEFNVQNGFCGVNTQGRNKRCVWDITTKPYKEAHFATFPEDLVKPMIQAGCPENGIVLDIFAGSGTTLKVAKEMNRNYIGIELNKDYLPLIEKRINGIPLRLAV